MTAPSPGRATPRRRTDALASAGVFAVSVLVQVVLFGQYLDNAIVNGHSQPGDAFDYAGRASTWAEQGFTAAFSDAFRVPGYPAYLLATTWLSPESGLQLARMGQVAAIALASVIAYLTLRTYVSVRWSVIGALVVACYPPLAFWAPVLTAEALSILLLSLAILVLARRHRAGYRWLDLAALGVLVLGLAYLKPNNVILLVPIALFIGLATAWKGWWRMAVIPAVVALGLAPWIAFGSAQQGQVIASSTTAGGITMYWGLGAIPSSGDNPLFDDLARSIGVRGPDAPPFEYVGETEAEHSAHFTEVAIQAWRENPLRQSAWAAVKVAHLSGFLPRGPRDIVLGAVVIAGLTASVVLWRRPDLRPWSALVAGTYLMVVLQGIVFLGDQRYRATLFDYPALLGCTLAASFIAARLVQRR